MHFVTHYRKRSPHERGFTLIETLVAVSILLVVVTGPMTVAVKGMQSSYFANEQTTAVFLAQEAVESIQKLRDDTALDVLNGGGSDTRAWFGALDPVCTGANGCDIDVTDGSFTDCTSDGSECILEINPAQSVNNPIYGYGSGWTSSPYMRRIYLNDASPLGDGSQIGVTVEVSWESTLFTSGPRTVVLQTWVYDQYKRFE